MRKNIVIGYNGSSLQKPISSFNSLLPADPNYRILWTIMKEKQMDEVKNYSLIVFLGDNVANHVPNGNVWWAWSKELDTIGDGYTPEEAIINCQEGMKLKISCMLDKGLPVPSSNIITTG